MPDLVKQTATNRTVLARYERHFRTRRAHILPYFERLRPSTLAQTRRYLVFNIDDDMIVRHKMLLLRRGTPVFVDAAGRAVLKTSCGNPMVAYGPPLSNTAAQLEGENDLLEGDEIADLKGPSEVDRTLTEAENAEQDSLMGLEPTDLAASGQSFAEVPETLTGSTSSAGPAGGSSMAPSGAPTSMQTPPTLSGTVPTLGGGGGVLAGLGGLAVLLASISDDTTPLREAMPVPEPATLIVLGAAAGLALRPRRR